MKPGATKRSRTTAMSEAVNITAPTGIIHGAPRIGDEASQRLLESVTLHQWAGASQDLNALSRRTAQTRANSSFAFSQLRN